MLYFISEEKLARDNALAYWAHLKVAEKMKCCENGPCTVQLLSRLKYDHQIIKLQTNHISLQLHVQHFG